MTRTAFTTGMLGRAVPRLLLTFVLAATAVGCAATAGVRPGIAPNIPPYNGPKARIAVSRFDYKAAKGSQNVGDGLATMLTTELVNTNRFIVLEREQIKDVLTEQDLGAGGRVSAETAAPIGEISGAEILVMGAVTAFEPEKMGVGGMLLGGVTVVGTALLHSKNDNVPIMGASYVESYLAMDIRMVDTKTSRVLASLSVEGKAADMGAGVLFAVGGGRSRLPMAFGGWQKASVEEAMRIAIARAVEGIVNNLPAEYYQHAPSIGDGEIMGYSYLDFPAAGTPTSSSRQAVQAGGSRELETALKEWGLPVPPSAGQVNFEGEVVVAAIGSPADRASSLSIQKIVNDAGAVRVEIAVLPPPPDFKPDPKQPPPSIPFIAARITKTGKPLNVQWVTP